MLCYLESKNKYFSSTRLLDEKKNTLDIFENIQNSPHDGKT